MKSKDPSLRKKLKKSIQNNQMSHFSRTWIQNYLFPRIFELQKKNSNPAEDTLT